MSTNAKPSFGFGDLKPASGLDETMTRKLDLLGEQLGFASREAAVRRRRRPPTEEPTDQLNVRASIADINKFVEWCERKRYSYREGFGLLVAKIED